MASIPGPSTQSPPGVKQGPPDGGWGWVVVLSSLFISLIADGISFSYGLLYIEFLNYFRENNYKTSWIGSIFIAVPYMSGPLMSPFVDRYGCRITTIIGGLIAGVGFILSAFVKNVELMCVTFGVVTGLGLGVSYVTCVVSVAYWFDHKITLATSLGASGSGIGTLIYAPMVRFFIKEYGWRGTVLLLAGTLFHLCICGCVMRDPAWLIAEQRREKIEETYARSTSRKSSSFAMFSMTKTRSIGHLSSVDLNKGKHLQLNKSVNSSKSIPVMNVETASFTDKGELKSSNDTNMPDSIEKNMFHQPWYTGFMAMSRTMFTFSMFLESHFLMLSIATCLLFTWFTIPIIYISEHLIINGHTEDDGVVMLSVLGAANIIGMIALGWMGGSPRVNVSIAYSICLIVSGLAACVIPAFNNLPFIMTCMGVYGFFYASTYSFTPVIVLELLPLDQFASGYGMIMLCMGVGCLIGPPMAGALFDAMQSWDISYVLGGVSIMVSGFIVMFIPLTKNRRLCGRRR